MPWPDSVERVAQALRAARIEARIEELASGAPADAPGADPDQIVDMQLFSVGGRTVLTLVPGGARIDPELLAAAAGAPGEPVDGDASFPPRADALVLADRTLLAHDRVWIQAGSLRHVASLTPSDLIRVTWARTVELVRGG
jgi:prolyl-tRNA editing enzyme YbaK/EbsC (Cys-tRNA(Pro) deacylase)